MTNFLQDFVAYILQSNILRLHLLWISLYVPDLTHQLDLIGMQRIYEREIDRPSLQANQKLVKSVPPGPNKQALFRHLKPLGFTGYKVTELTPSKTRRAQVANWILYYREELHGVSIEELKERRRLKRETEAKAQKGKENGDGWKYPLKESF